MLPLDHNSWQERITRWLGLLDQLKPAHLERVKRYAGPGYTGETDRAKYDPISHTYNSISTWLPSMLSGAPRFAVGSSREEGITEARMLEAGLNRLVVQSDWVTTNELVAVDFWIGPYAVTYNTMEPIAGFSEYDELPHRPARHRLCPFDFVADADSFPWTNWRFMGHRDVMDHDDALELAESEDSGWIYDALMEISPGIVRKKEDRVLSAPGEPEDRGEFEFFKVWCPEVEADDLREMGYDIPEEDEYGRPLTAEGGYNGAIFYVLKDQNLTELEGIKDGFQFVHVPEMFYGPRWGPYTYYPAYVVPDEGITLAPDVAVASQAEGMNTGARTVLRGLQRNKRMVAVAAAAPDLKKLIEDGDDGGVISLQTIDDLTKNMREFSVGGITADMVAGAEYLYNLYQMASGMGDAQRGETTGRGTATENAIAARATGAKVGFISGKIRKGVENDGRTAGWWMYHHEMFEQELGPEYGYRILRGGSDSAILKRSPQYVKDVAIAKYGSLEAAIRLIEKEEEQKRKDNKGDPFDRMDFSVDALSMERSPDGVAAAQLAGVRDTLPVLCDMLMRYPFLRPEDTTELFGELGSIKGLERLIDVPMLRQVQALMLQQQIQPTPAGPEARLSWDRAPQKSALPAASAPSPSRGIPGGSAMPGLSTGALAGAASQGAA